MQSIAIIGTGISAMGAAYFLKDKFKIVFYDKADYAGGHTNTLSIDENGRTVYIDSAFMVYNEITYPNLTRLFSELSIDTKPTDMSFSVQHKQTGLEYSGTGLSGLFAQRRNIVSGRHWSLLMDIHKFNKEAPDILLNDRYRSYSLKNYIEENGYSDAFVQKFLIPISSAVWSTPPDLMLEFPAVTLVQFFKNHGFLGLKGHYQWRTVHNGSKQYRDRILSYFPGKVNLNNAVLHVNRTEHRVLIVNDRGDRNYYDKVIIACHADEALKLLDDATELETDLLSKFKYQNNRVTLHTDESVMPNTREAWSAWNYRMGLGGPSTVYWMNRLQQVSDQKNYFISVNGGDEVHPSAILWDSNYSHPLFDVDAIQAQSLLPLLNDNGLVYFCGAYFNYGFHEDGLTSGLNVARAISGEQIWN